MQKESNESRNNKQRRLARDFLYVFPSNRFIDKYLENATYLNLKKAADYLITNKNIEVVTIRLDDTTKAADYELYDVKADHITISYPYDKRKTLTTRYLENASLSVADGAAVNECKLRCLAILANTGAEKIKTAVDFWMTNRAGGCGKFLEGLGID